MRLGSSFRLVHKRAASSECSPPPCKEGLGVGVVRRLTFIDDCASPPDPHPYPPRKAEGVRRVCRARIDSFSWVRASNFVRGAKLALLAAACAVLTVCSSASAADTSGLP